MNSTNIAARGPRRPGSGARRLEIMVAATICMYEGRYTAHDPEDPNSLPGNWVRSVIEDTLGGLELPVFVYEHYVEVCRADEEA